MKSIAAHVATAVLGAVIGFGVLYAFMAPRTPHPVQAIEPQYVGNQIDFLNRCSGIPLENDTRQIVVASCMSRIRGFTDGTSLAATIAVSDPAQPKAEQNNLWCFNQQMNDQQLFDSVLLWTLNHSQRYASVTKGFTDDQTAATAVMIAALHETFPCEEK